MEPLNMRTNQQNLRTLNNKEQMYLKEKKENRASGTCETITEDLTFMSWECPGGEEKEKRAEKAFKEIMAEKFPD